MEHMKTFLSGFELRLIPWIRVPREAEVDIQLCFISKRGLFGTRSDAQVGETDHIQVSSGQKSCLVDPQERRVMAALPATRFTCTFVEHGSEPPTHRFQVRWWPTLLVQLGRRAAGSLEEKN